MKAAALLVAAIVLTTGCTGASSSGAPAHVFVIVMENHSPEEALSGAFTAQLAGRSGIAENYHAVAHPSVPNYLALTSGQTWGVTDDSYHALPRADIGDQLTSAGLRWRAYMDGLTGGGCFDSPPPYDPGHNPFSYYGGACPSNVVPFDNLQADLQKGALRFSWITPDMCHDEHSCPVTTGDAWLRATVGMITSSPSWKAGSVLFITWDEDDGSADNRVLTIVVRPDRGRSVSSAAYTHYSLLATIEGLLGLPRLGNAATAAPMTDLVS